MLGNAQGWKCPHLSGHLIHFLMKKLLLMPCCQHLPTQLPSFYLHNDPKHHHFPGPWFWSTWATPTDGQMLSLRQTDAAGGCMTADCWVPVVLGVSAHPRCCRWPSKAGQGHVKAVSCLMNKCQAWAPGLAHEQATKLSLALTLSIFSPLSLQSSKESQSMCMWRWDVFQGGKCCGSFLFV